jgi:hypothetical protein
MCCVPRLRRFDTLLGRAGERVRSERLLATEFRLYESHLSAAGSRCEVKCRFRPIDESADQTREPAFQVY